MFRTRRGGLVLAEEGPRSRGARLITGAIVAALVIGVAVAAYVAIRAAISPLGGARCEAVSGDERVAFSPDQMDNAATIVGVAMGRDLPARAGTIAIATAIQESKLENLRYGDRDSLGLFQQRPSQGWGTAEQVLDPEYAANRFYDHLVKIEDYETKEVTKVAQAVQRSAFPEAYADHEPEARIVASVLSGHTTAAMTCRLKDPTGPTDLTVLQRELENQLGVTAEEAGGRLVVTSSDERRAWLVGAWAVAKSTRFQLVGVQVGERQWVRGGDDGAAAWGTVAPNPSIGSTTTVIVTTPR